MEKILTHSVNQLIVEVLEFTVNSVDFLAVLFRIGDIRKDCIGGGSANAR